MKVDSQPFPQANVVELSDFGPKGQNLAFQINMAGPMRLRDEQRKEAASGKRPQDKHELADMNAWDAEGQEPISGITLEDCDRIEATKNGLRLVLSTGLTE
jgi:hypothetical protein